MDKKVFIGPPDLEARIKIFQLNLKGKPLGDFDFEELARMADGYSGADIRHICMKASLIPFRESITTGEDREILIDDMLIVMEKVKPSIGEDMVKKYASFKF